jgi:ankyrin repeat protein
MKGDLGSLENYFANGLRSDQKTEKEGWNLLHQSTVLAGKPANVNSVELLLSKGVSPNIKDTYGNLPIHYSVKNNDIATVKLLINFCSEINVLNNEGISPLHQALLNPNICIELVQLLLSSGASKELGTVNNFVNSINNSAVKEVFAQHGN